MVGSGNGIACFHGCVRWDIPCVPTEEVDIQQHQHDIDECAGAHLEGDCDFA